jgi:hypothetical protein
VEGSFEDLLERAAITDFRFHDLRHTFASWFMMNGGDLYELAKIPGHSNNKMTERDAKLGRQHIARTGSSAREIGKLLEKPICDVDDVRILFARLNRTPDASLFRAACRCCQLIEESAEAIDRE